MALELAQLSGLAVDMGAALPALHALIERRAVSKCSAGIAASCW